MTIDEAINYMEALVSNNTMFPPMKTAAKMAIDALRSQRAKEKNVHLSCKGCKYESSCPSETHCHGFARMYSDNYIPSKTA